jgi:hypothetical protein
MQRSRWKRKGIERQAPRKRRAETGAGEKLKTKKKAIRSIY